MTQREIGQASENHSDIAYSTERDPVGEMRVPADMLYGIQTLRALENFRISPLRVHAALITAYALLPALTYPACHSLHSCISIAILADSSELVTGRLKSANDSPRSAISSLNFSVHRTLYDLR